MIHIIPEGSTETKVIEKILQDSQPHIYKGEGKTRIANHMRAVIIPNHTGRVRCLILRDLDAHDGETRETIQQSIQNMLRRILQELDYQPQTIEFAPLEAYGNVYTLTLPQPDVRLAVHLATSQWKDSFIKSTIDDYVLALSLQKEVVENLIRKKKWEKVQADEVIRKVTVEIPGLLTQNHIPLREAKDYVRLYAALMQLHTSPPVFAEKVLANAPQEEIDRVFASLQAAVDFLGGG